MPIIKHLLIPVIIKAANSPQHLAIDRVNT